MVFTDTSNDECTIAKFKTWPLQCTYSAVGIRSLILAWTPLWIPDMFAVRSYSCILIFSRYSQDLLKQLNTIFTGIFACPRKSKKFLSKSDSTTSTFYKPYTHGDLFMCWYISSSPQIKAKYSEILHALTIFWRTISPLISIIFFCISGDVYFIISSN